MYNVFLFGIKLKINPIAFTVPIGNGWDIYWYGITIAVGFCLALLYAFKNAKRFNVDIDRALDVILVTTPVAVLCARAYYIIFYGEKLTGIGDFFGFSGSGFSGLAIYGGVIGALVCGAIMCKIKKIKILDMFDLTMLGFLIGQAVGRWGNFFNQEAYGTFTGSSFFGMQSEKTIIEMGSEGLVHPCFLYESIWCLIGFILINKLSKKRRFSGETLLMYGVWYGFGRAVIESLRTDSLMIGSLRVSLLLSVIAFIVCLCLLIFLRKKHSGKNETYNPIISPEIREAENKTDKEGTINE